MARTLGIIAVKGGVGKTTVAAALATDLANHYKQRVLLVDGNHTTPHISLHMNVGLPNKTIQDILLGKANSLAAIHKRYGVDVIPGDMIYPRSANPYKLKNAIEKIGREYDFVIIDSAPTFGDETKAVLNASDGTFIVSTADEPTVHASLAAAKMINNLNGKVHGLIINKTRDKDFSLNAKEIEKATGIPVVACLPDDISVNRALFTQIPAPIYKRNSEFSQNLTKLSATLSGIPVKASIFERIFSLNKKPEAVNRELLRSEFYTSMFEK